MNSTTRIEFISITNRVNGESRAFRGRNVPAEEYDVVNGLAGFLLPTLVQVVLVDEAAFELQ